MTTHNVKVSPEDQHLLDSNRWLLNNYGYAIRYEGGGRRGQKKLVCYLLHRIIVGAVRGQVVDHINGDRLDNRRENLRICTHAENMQNRRTHKNNKTGLANVSMRENNSSITYIVSVTHNGVRHRKGGFVDKVDAYEYARSLTNTLHGEYSKHQGCLNAS